MRNRWGRRRTVTGRALVEEEKRRDLRKESENERKKVHATPTDMWSHVPIVSFGFLL